MVDRRVESKAGATAASKAVEMDSSLVDRWAACSVDKMVEPWAA